MGFLTNFLNPNAMSNERIIEFANHIVNAECKSEIENLIGGMMRTQELHNAFRGDLDPNCYIDFLREFTNLLDQDDSEIQRKAYYFANSFGNDLRVTTRSHPIIKLYSLIADLNTCCKNYCICEYNVIKAIYAAKSEAEAEQRVLDLRESSNYHSKESAKRLNTLMSIMDNPSKVLNLKYSC